MDKPMTYDERAAANRHAPMSEPMADYDALLAVVEELAALEPMRSGLSPIIALVAKARALAGGVQMTFWQAIKLLRTPQVWTLPYAGDEKLGDMMMTSDHIIYIFGKAPARFHSDLTGGALYEPNFFAFLVIAWTARRLLRKLKSRS